jgi:hypothetical protein
MFNKIKRMYQRAVYGIDTWAIEHPDEYVADFNFFMATAKVNWLEENEDLTNKETLKEFKMLQEIAFGMAGYAEMCSGIYCKKDAEFKRLTKEYKHACDLLRDNTTILW